MATISYTAEVKEDGTLALPQEARAALGLKPGDLVDVSFDVEEQETVVALQDAFDDIASGRTRPAREALEELRQKHGIPR